MKKYINVYSNGTIGMMEHQNDRGYPSVDEADRRAAHDRGPRKVLEIDFDVLFSKPAEPTPAVKVLDRG